MAVKKVPDFRRAAGQRLAAAQELFKQGHFLDAKYLGGYVVECAFKALILRRTPAAKHPKVWEQISEGLKGHNLEYLKAVLAQRHCVLPLTVVQRLRTIAAWTTDWRYAVGQGSYADAKEFLDAAEHIRDWVERSW